MKKNPEKPEKEQAPSGVDSWSNEMHHRFVPDPGVVPLGKTLSLARRIQRKARPHDLTRSIMDRYGKRRQDGSGSSGDMPFHVPYRPGEVSVPVVQGVFRENSNVQKQTSAPVVSGQSVVARADEPRKEGMLSSPAAHDGGRAAQEASGEARFGSVTEKPPMVPASVSFAQGLNQGKRSLVQRALHRSDGTMGLLKGRVKTSINHKTNSPVVQAKPMTGRSELQLPPARGKVEAHAGLRAGDAIQTKEHSRPSSALQTGLTKPQGASHGPAPQTSAHPDEVTFQRETLSQETVHARAANHSVHQDLPVSKSSSVSQDVRVSPAPGADSSVSQIKQDRPKIPPSAQGRPKSDTTVPVIQAKEQTSPPRMAATVVRTPHSSVETEARLDSFVAEPAQPVTRAESPVRGSESGDLPVQRKGRESLSSPEITETVNPAIQAVRQTGAQASKGPERPLVHSRPAGDRTESRSSSGGNETPSGSVQVQNHTGPSSQEGTVRHPKSSVPALNGQMPVVSPVQAVTENRTLKPVPIMTSETAVQAKTWPGGPHVPLAQASSTDNSVSVAQRVRVPEIRQNQAVDFQPMPMAKSGDASPSSAPHLPVQRQSEAETRAQQGPSLPDASASQPSPVSMEPMAPPTMEGNTMANLHEIAERVYEMLMDRLSIERESLGL